MSEAPPDGAGAAQPNTRLPDATPNGLGARTWRWGVLAIAALSAAVQVVAFGAHLNSGRLNSISPGSIDTLDYYWRADLLRSGDIVGAFGDGFRTPGYPLYLALTDAVAGDNGPLLARLGQMAAIAATAVLVAVAAARLSSRRVGIGAGVITALYLPFGYLAQLLYAEALSILLVAVLMVLLTSARPGRPQVALAVGLGATVVALVMLKPNHVLLFVPVGAMILVLQRRHAVRTIGALAAVGAVGIAPWSVFVSANNDRFIPLSTTQGANLLIGTGAIGTQESGGSIAWAIDTLELERWGLIFAEWDTIPGDASAAEFDAAYSRLARQIIRERPGVAVAYASIKGAYAFGVPPMRAQDVVLLVVALAGAVSALVLSRRSELRHWAVFALVVYGVVALQAMLFLPNQRFRLTLLDVPALVLVAVTLAQFTRRHVDLPTDTASG